MSAPLLRPKSFGSLCDVRRQWPSVAALSITRETMIGEELEYPGNSLSGAGGNVANRFQGPSFEMTKTRLLQRRSRMCWRARRSRAIRLVGVDGSIVAFLFLAAGCGSVQDVDQAIANSEVTISSNTQIVGADGPLTSMQSADLLTDIADDSGSDGLLRRHLAIEEAVAGTPLTTGNKTHLLEDGDGAFTAIFDAIRSAKHHVNLEYYTLDDVVFGHKVGRVSPFCQWRPAARSR